MDGGSYRHSSHIVSRDGHVALSPVDVGATLPKGRFCRCDTLNSHHFRQLVTVAYDEHTAPLVDYGLVGLSVSELVGVRRVGSQVKLCHHLVLGIVAPPRRSDAHGVVSIGHVDHLVVHLDGGTHRYCSQCFGRDGNVAFAPVDVGGTLPNDRFLDVRVFVGFTAYGKQSAAIAHAVGIFYVERVFTFSHVGHVECEPSVGVRGVSGLLCADENLADTGDVGAVDGLGSSYGEPSRTAVCCQ